MVSNCETDLQHKRDEDYLTATLFAESNRPSAARKYLVAINFDADGRSRRQAKLLIKLQIIPHPLLLNQQDRVLFRELA